MSIAKCEFTKLAIRYPIRAMLTSSEIRRVRLKMLEEKFGGLANLNEKLGWSRTDPKLSQIKNNNKRPGRDATYQMGDAMAREIEEKLELERGWMDTPPSYAEIHGKDDPRATLMQAMESMTINQLSTAAALIQALKQSQSNNEQGSA